MIDKNAMQAALKELKKSDEYKNLLETIEDSRRTNTSFCFSFGRSLPARNLIDRLRPLLEEKHGRPKGVL